MQHALLERWWFTHSPHSKHHTTRNNDIWRYLKAIFNLNSYTHVNTILLQTRFGRCRYGTRIRRKWKGAEVERGQQLFFFFIRNWSYWNFMCVYMFKGHRQSGTVVSILQRKYPRVKDLYCYLPVILLHFTFMIPHDAHPFSGGTIY